MYEKNLDDVVEKLYRRFWKLVLSVLLRTFGLIHGELSRLCVRPGRVPHADRGTQTPK